MDPNVLTNWNRAMAAMHGVFFVATLATADMGMALPLYRAGFKSPALSPPPAPSDLADELTFSWTVPSTAVYDRRLLIAWVAAGFSALSALFHLLNAQVWRKWYLDGIEACRCPSRWIEYSLSAPLQAVAIAYLTGSMFTDVIVAIFALISTTMFFGYLTEEYAARPAGVESWSRPPLARLQPHFLGYVPFLAAVAIILQAFVRGASAEFVDEEKVRKMPAFVTVIVVSQLLLFSSFTVVQLVVTLRPPMKYYQGELAYMGLSLGAKGVLSFLLLSNVIAIDVFGDSTS